MKRDNSRKIFPNIRYLILIIGTLLLACQVFENTPVLIEKQFLTSTPTIAIEQVPSPFATQTKQPLVTPIPGTANVGSLPVMEPAQILNADFASDSFQDLIIFTNSQGGFGPFANFRLPIQWAEVGESHIYAFSPNGQRAGTLTPTIYASTIYVSPNRSEKPMLVEYGVEFDHPAIQSIELPPECYHPARTGERLLPCGKFQFSPDGRYLGFFYGSEECLRAIIIQDTQRGVQMYHSMQASGHYFSLLKDGKAIIATGHCEGGSISLYDLEFRVGRTLGVEGSSRWNVDKSAFVVEAGSYGGIDSIIWGFNIESNQLFLEAPETHQIDDHPVWTPDKQYLLYQHRTFIRASDGFTATGFDKPREVILVNAQSGEQKTLLSDPDYDFHLGSCWNCDEWFGDWIQVRRVAFTPEALTGGDDIYRSHAYTCRIYAEGCSTTVESFALNWKTGELKPWEEYIRSGLMAEFGSTETPGPDRTRIIYKHPQGRYTLYEGPDKNTFWIDWVGGGEAGMTILSGPDFSLDPIYKHPTGLYAYYVGIDGNTLWMVPAEGIPLPWVFDSRNYFYLDKK